MEVEDQESGESAGVENQESGESAEVEDQESGESAEVEDQESGESAVVEDQESGESAKVEDQERGESVEVKQQEQVERSEVVESKTSDGLTSSRKRKHTLSSINKGVAYVPSEAAVKFLQNRSRSVLPFPCASQRFYSNQNRKQPKIQKDRGGNRNYLVYSEKTQSLALNERKNVDSCTCKTKHAELCAVVAIATELKKCLPLPSSTAATIY